VEGAENRFEKRDGEMTIQPKGIIGVKTVDGRIVPVLNIHEHTCNRTIFTTIADRQKSAEFELFYQRDRSSQWLYLDSLPVPGIPPAKAGEPDLSVKARLDGKGNLELEISDPAAKKPSTYILKTETLAGRYRSPTKTSVHGRHSSFSTPSKAPVGMKNNKRIGIGGWLILLLFGFGLILFALFFSLRPASFAARRDKEPEKQKTEGVRKEEEITSVKSLRMNVEKPSKENPSLVTNRQEYSFPKTELYCICWGDTLWRITERFYDDRGIYSELAGFNQISDPDLIVAGDTLCLPPELSGKQRSDSRQE
jgi:molecular chaperone DnaK (HSP70)